MEHTMTRLILREEEVSQIRSIVAELAGKHGTSESLELHEEAALAAYRLPARVQAALREFKLREPASGLCIISGYPIDDQRLGPTPSHWQDTRPRCAALEEEVALVVLASLLGDCIGWATQQDGRLVHDIVPIEAHRKEQLGSGSEQTLTWHTEDAFHPCRGDYLGMACLRNPDHVPTTYASLENIRLPDEHWNLLFEALYTIRPDESHQIKNKAGARAVDEDLKASYSKIDCWNVEPEKVAVLSGDRDSPYLRIDPYFMDRLESANGAQQAFDALVGAVDEKLEDLVLQPGDFCFIDNFKAVHGRRPFKARFDGTDRWMKRVNVVRDLRKSREYRHQSESRVIA